MGDDATLALLQEIRDLQKQQVEYLRTTLANQQQSLANQQQSLTVQQGVVERQKKVLEKSSRLWIFVLLGAFVLFFMQFFPFFFKLLLRR
jgi:hypothetical protein